MGYAQLKREAPTLKSDCPWVAGFSSASAGRGGSSEVRVKNGTEAASGPGVEEAQRSTSSLQDACRESLAESPSRAIVISFMATAQDGCSRDANRTVVPARLESAPWARAASATEVSAMGTNCPPRSSAGVSATAIDDGVFHRPSGETSGRVQSVRERAFQDGGAMGPPLVKVEGTAREAGLGSPRSSQGEPL